MRYPRNLLVFSFFLVISSVFILITSVHDLFHSDVKAPAEDGLKWFEDVDPDVIRHRATGVCYYIGDHGIYPLFNPDGSLFTLED